MHILDKNKISIKDHFKTANSLLLSQKTLGVIIKAVEYDNP